MDFWNTWANLAELWWTRHGGLGAQHMAAHRLDLLLRYAREYSPYYGRLYDGFPARLPLEALPVAHKADLMAHFDDWSTDRRVRLRDVKAFLADRKRVGERFLGRYCVWKSSGTTGKPGIFLQDDPAMAAYDALVVAQLEEVAWRAGAATRLMAAGGRAAMVVATGDHFASIASWERIRRAFPALDARSFGVLSPLPQLVRELNECQPAFLAAYPSVLELLAEERAAGRLDIAPALAWSGGETLSPAARKRIERAFGCALLNEYGASECLSIAHECPEGWQHLHSEWVMLEAVDRDGLPVRPGEVSHTVLLTNLANWVQPVIRYDLGDRMVQAPSPCTCGNPTPAFRIEGRADDILTLRSARGKAVRLAPMALSTVVEEAAGELRFQVAQTAPDRLALRFAHAQGDGDLEPVKRKATRELRAWLATQSLGNVRLTLEAGPPRPDAPSGKLRTVIVDRPAISA
jgi:putative adenylate-forming enzyme